jgi:hypothetical protein
LDGRQLVKIGWSKAKKKEYEHRAPREVLDVLAESILAVSRTRKRFTVEDLVPLRHPQEGTEIPSYQTYLCVAWLRQEGLLRQHGRDGYTLARDSDLKVALTALLSKLPDRAQNPNFA